MDGPSRVCNVCGTAYPETKQYFYVETKGKNGLRRTCKYCRNLEMAVERDADPEVFKTRWRVAYYRIKADPVKYAHMLDRVKKAHKRKKLERTLEKHNANK